MSGNTIISIQNLTTDTAVAIATRGVHICRDKGIPVSATVVDRAGNVLAAVRANNAGPATLDGSRRKAYSAVNFGMNSGVLAKLVLDEPMLHALGDIHEILPLQGAVLIKVNDQIVGALGVGGATGQIDEDAAAQAIASVFGD